MTAFNIDISELFQELIGNRLFVCTAELMYLLRQFSTTSRSHYSIRTSKRNSEGVTTFMKFICQNKKYRTQPSRGLRRRENTTTNCEAYFNVGRCGNRLGINSFAMVHNHELLSGEPGMWHARNRRLNAEKLEIIRPLIECRDTAYNVKYFVKNKFQKNLTTQDVMNLQAN